MISAFAGGFMAFMGMYVAYKVIRTGVIQHFIAGVRQAVEDEKTGNGDREDEE